MTTIRIKGFIPAEEVLLNVDYVPTDNASKETDMGSRISIVSNPNNRLLVQIGVVVVGVTETSIYY